VESLFYFLEIHVLRVSRVFSVCYPQPYGYPQFANGDNTWWKLQITKLLTACFYPANFQMAERGKPHYTKMFFSTFLNASWLSYKCAENDGPRLWAEMIMNCIRSNFSGRVPILWILKRPSVPVSHKICFGTPNIRDFPNHKNDLRKLCVFHIW
jgi:hypothetical protein